jgi:hypothetical protein
MIDAYSISQAYSNLTCLTRGIRKLRTKGQTFSSLPAFASRKRSPCAVEKRKTCGLLRHTPISPGGFPPIVILKTDPEYLSELWSDHESSSLEKAFHLLILGAAKGEWSFTKFTCISYADGGIIRGFLF